METISINQLRTKLETAMNEQVIRLGKDLSTMRTGRASPQLLENVKVDCYGSQMPIKQVAALSVPDARTIEVSPWDPSMLAVIEKALLQADLGTTPVNDGKLLRISLPQMTEDRRKSLVKTIKTMAEDFKVRIRNERRDAIEKVKKSQKAKEISEDDCKRFEQDIQKLTDSFIAKIDAIIGEKEKELMTV